MLFFLMCAKLIPEVLDWMDIFVLELEELFIPKVISVGKKRHAY